MLPDLHGLHLRLLNVVLGAMHIPVCSSGSTTHLLAQHPCRYPYFAGVNQRSIDINFVLGANGISQQGCMLVSMINGVRIALQKIGYPNLPIVIGETGMVPVGEKITAVGVVNR